MPIIDLQCHFGVSPETRALPQPSLADALSYADQYGVETLCFTSHEAVTDIDGGNARLDEELKKQPRFRGWLNLSVHQAELSIELSGKYFRTERWIGARFEQAGHGDTLLMAGGRDILNGLRRHGKPILATVSSPETLTAVIEAAREFHTLRFFINPQSEELTGDAVAAIREQLNISIVPVAAYTERDVLGHAAQTLGERGERRILWASDWGRFHPATALGAVRDAALTAPQRERFLYRNARELMPA